MELEIEETVSFDEVKIKEYLIHTRENLNSSDDKIRRKAIETFLDKIIIYDDKVEINLKVAGSVGGGEPLITLHMTFVINLQKGIIKASYH